MAKVLILAGGLGTRLSDITQQIPKALVPLGNKTIIEHQLDLLESQGFDDIFVSLGYKAQQVMDHLGDRVRYIVEDEPLGTGGAIKLAIEKIEDDLIVLSGDMYTDVEFSKAWQAHQISNKDITIIVLYRINDELYHEIVIEEGQVIGYNPDPQEVKECYHSSGFYIVSPNVLRSEKRNKFSIERDIFPYAAGAGQMGYYLHSGFSYDLGTKERLERANLRLLSQQNAL